jgi:hypothetical protein
MRIVATLVLLGALVSPAAASVQPRYAVSVSGTAVTTWTQDGCTSWVTATGACTSRTNGSGGETLVFKTPAPLLLSLAQLRDPGRLQQTQLPPFAAALTRYGSAVMTYLSDGSQRQLDNSGCGAASFTVPFPGVVLGWGGTSSTFELGLARPGQIVFGSDCPSLQWGMLPFHLTQTAAPLASAVHQTRTLTGTATIDRSHPADGIAGSTQATWTVKLLRVS